jgi:hypothetical protein
MFMYGDIADFLQKLGEPTKHVAMSLEELDERVPRTLRVVLPSTSHVPRAVFGADYDWNVYEYVTELKDAHPTKVLAATHYEKDDEAITVVNAQWTLVVDCFRHERGSDIGPWLAAIDAQLIGSIQCYLPDDPKSLAQIISSDLRPADFIVLQDVIGG